MAMACTLLSPGPAAAAAAVAAHEPRRRFSNAAQLSSCCATKNGKEGGLAQQLRWTGLVARVSRDVEGRGRSRMQRVLVECMGVRTGLSRSRNGRQFAFMKSVSSYDFGSTTDGEDMPLYGTWAASMVMPSLISFSGAANATSLEDDHISNMAYGEVGAGLEFGVQFIYLGALIGLLGVGVFLVVRQVLIRRELESAAKELQDRVRSGEATSEEYFELGAVMLRKKYYVLANKYLEQAIKKWDGDEADLAQVYNALGFSYFSDNKLDGAIGQYEKAVKLQPGYVKAWNNLGDSYEKKKDFLKALKAYEEVLQFDPSNKIAKRQRDAVKERVERFRGIPTNES